MLHKKNIGVHSCQKPQKGGIKGWEADKLGGWKAGRMKRLERRLRAEDGGQRTEDRRRRTEDDRKDS